MSRMPMRVNTVVSNVPGPPIPLYMCGARITAVYPSSVILEGMGLNITVFSYQERLDFGLHVDPDLVPDPWLIADGVTLAMAELMEASGLGSPTPVELPLSSDAAKPADEPVAAAPAPKPRKPRAPKAPAPAKATSDEAVPA
jgi:hypothetical protein